MNSESQIPVEEDAWEKTILEIKDQHGIHWDWSKDGLQCPNVRLIPSAVGRYSDTDTGRLQFTVSVTTDGRAPLDSVFEFTVEPFEPFRIESVAAQVSQSALTDRSQTIIIRLQDPYNNHFPVSGERWNCVQSLTVTNEYGISWNCRRGPGDGEFQLTPGLADGAEAPAPGKYEFTVIAIYDDGDLTDWTATEKLTVEVTE